MLASAVADAADPWWIIGSAAVALHGAKVPDVRDVDLLMSAGDAQRILRRLGAETGAAKRSAKFRSDVFGTWSESALPVEIMGGFSVATPAGWRPVVPETREAVSVGDQRLFVPSAAELEALLRSFGRDKDFERARLLRA